MTDPRNREKHLVLQAGTSEPATPQGGSPAHLTDDFSDMLIRNPAPDGSPSRQPSGTYRIVSG